MSIEHSSCATMSTTMRTVAKNKGLAVDRHLVREGKW